MTIRSSTLPEPSDNFDMGRYRIGNDMTVLWSINDRNGAALPLNDKEVHLYYTCERGRFEADIEIQDGNVVAWNFLGTTQRVLGSYTLTLEVVQPYGKRSIKKDICNAFILVGKECEEHYDTDGAHINEGGEITLVSDLDIYRIAPIVPYIGKNGNWWIDGVDTGEYSKGTNAYEYAVSKGYTGTEEEFARLQAGIPGLYDRVDEFEEAVRDQVNNYKPIVINGDVTNAADEEDITSENKLLKLKDRPALNGMGYVILRKGQSFAEQVTKANTIYEIRYDFDLSGNKVSLGSGAVLKFNGGSIINGTIVGNDSKIEANLTRIFSNIVLDGTWLLNEVYSLWFDFKDGEVDNIGNFRNMMVLATSSMLTHIYIQEGEWFSSAFSTNDDGTYKDTIGISVPSNVYIHNAATIKQLPNSYEKTSLFYLGEVENVTIEGGKLIGDVRTHTGTTGEWNIGIYPVGARNIIIKNIEISEFWGDGIDIQSPYDDYVNQSSEGCCKNVIVENVKCLNNRRQGMSVEAVDGLLVKNSEFRGTGSIKYTPPGAGIDVEPWHMYQTIRNITIQNCTICGNKAGLLFHLNKSNLQDNNIKVENCTLGEGIWCKNVNNLVVSHCTTGSHCSLHENISNVKISDSTINGEIYLSGICDNIKFQRCDISSSKAQLEWTGYLVCFESKENASYHNITFADCYLNSNDKVRFIGGISSDTKVDFINNRIEGSSRAEFSLGWGDFIGNKVTFRATTFNILNRTNGKIVIKSNEFESYTYMDTVFNFLDTSSVVGNGITYDYEFINNKIDLTHGYWDIFGNTDIVKCLLRGNVFGQDILEYVPNHWVCYETIPNSEQNFKTLNVFPRTNIANGYCQKISIPAKRGLLKIYISPKNINTGAILNSETSIDVANPTSDVISCLTSINKIVDLNGDERWYLPVFAYEEVNDRLNIYIRDSGNVTFRNFVRVEYFSQEAIADGDIQYSVVPNPELTFSLNIVSKCKTSSLSLSSYINKYEGFEVLFNGKKAIYYGDKWVDAMGADIQS